VHQAPTLTRSDICRSREHKTYMEKQYSVPFISYGFISHEILEVTRRARTPVLWLMYVCIGTKWLITDLWIKYGILLCYELRFGTRSLVRYGGSTACYISKHVLWFHHSLQTNKLQLSLKCTKRDHKKGIINTFSKHFTDI